MIELSWLRAKLCDMYVDLIRLSIIRLVMYMFWLDEYVLLICMVFLNGHKGFQSKMHTLMKCILFARFYDMCAYGLILSTSGVLTPYSSIFPNILGSYNWRAFKTTLNEDLELSLVQVGTNLTFRGQCHYQPFDVVLVIRL